MTLVGVRQILTGDIAKFGDVIDLRRASMNLHKLSKVGEDALRAGKDEAELARLGMQGVFQPWKFGDLKPKERLGLPDRQMEHDILFVDDKASLAMAGYYEDLYLDNEMDDADMLSDQEELHEEFSIQMDSRGKPKKKKKDKGALQTNLRDVDGVPLREHDEIMASLKKAVKSTNLINRMKKEVRGTKQEEE